MQQDDKRFQMSRMNSHELQEQEAQAQRIEKVAPAAVSTLTHSCIMLFHIHRLS
jgi:hypothetical protein